METTKKTIEFMEEMKRFIDRAVVYRFTPLPGSPVYDNPKKFDLNLEDKDFRKFTIYNNPNHWWGTREDFEEMMDSYRMLQDYVDENFRR